MSGRQINFLIGYHYPNEKIPRFIRFETVRCYTHKPSKVLDYFLDRLKDHFINCKVYIRVNSWSEEIVKPESLEEGILKRLDKCLHYVIEIPHPKQIEKGTTNIAIHVKH